MSAWTDAAEVAGPARLESRHGWIEVVEMPGERFVVLGSSGYRAELPACGCEGRECCTIRLTTQHGFQHPIKLDNGRTSNGTDAWLKHTQTHCHAWHWPTVERFARDVLETYGARPAPRKLPPRSGPVLPLSEYAIAHLAELKRKYADQSVGAA